MSDKNTGGPAFACAGFRDHDVSYAPQDGMTLRDYFAAKAMVIGYKYWTEIFYPLVDKDGDEHPFSTDHNGLLNHIAEDAYKLADAMLKAREGGAA